MLRDYINKPYFVNLENENKIRNPFSLFEETENKYSVLVLIFIVSQHRKQNLNY